MPVMLLTKLGTNPWVIMGLILALTVGYFKTIVWSLEGDIASKNKVIAQLEANNLTIKSNLNETVKINENNNDVITEFQDDIVKLREHYELLLSSNDNETKKLKQIINNYRQEISYPRSMTIEECKIQIKDEYNESDITMSSINSIGF